MAQPVYISSINNSKILSRRSPRRDWNEYQHLATQGRFVEPKMFSGFQSPCIRLTSAKKQLYNPKLPSIRQIERDELLHRLADEHCRHTTRSTKEQFQSFDPRRETSFIEFSGLNWHNTGKSLLGMSTSSFMHADSSLEFGARLRPDKSPMKLYRSPTFDQNSRTRFYRDLKSPMKPTEGIFRSSSMHIWNPCNNANSSRTTQV